MNNLLPQVIHIPTCASTNDEAFSYLKQLPSCLVWTTQQSNGRGSRGRSWFGEPGAMLALTLGLQQPLRPEKTHFPYALFAGLWVMDTLTSLLPNANLKLKWPNDILLSGKKLCGILCESRWLGQSSQVVLGVGINLKKQSSLAELPKGYASLEQVTHDLIPAQICNHLAQSFPNAVKAYRQIAALKSAWLQQAWIPMYTQLVIHADGHQHSGTFAGLGSNGEMLLKSGHGMITIQQVCDDFEVIRTT